MDKINSIPMLLNLQLFAEGTAGAGTGGDGGTGAEGTMGATVTAAMSQKKGVKSNPLANVVYGKQAEEASPVSEVKTETTTEDRNAKYEAFIKEHKDLDDARIQNIVQNRLKGSKETVEKYNKLAPALERLATKYGIDATDPEALNKAIEEDDSYWEEEALEKGITVKQLKEIKKMERENAEFRKKAEERERREAAGKQYAQWMKQAEEAKRIYPGLDLETEAKNPQFLRLLNSGVDVGTAYKAIHMDELIPAAMQHTAKVVEQKITNKIVANGSRPTENGISSQGATVVKSDVSKLTKADRQEIIRRVARGEKISF